MSQLQHSVIHRLPQSWRITDAQPVEVQALAGADDYIALQLLSHDGSSAWDIMRALQQTLNEIQLECFVAEWQGQPCLFVHRRDESATNCRLKNIGVAIAEHMAVQPPQASVSN
ncbi:hypothetical protein CIG19_07975 [Enterobacterales bacterium CwR94]|nr:hypothetical protein CIG19_07975 [Enterobacterales bacterium CwR94]